MHTFTLHVGTYLCITVYDLGLSQNKIKWYYIIFLCSEKWPSGQVPDFLKQPIFLYHQNSTLPSKLNHAQSHPQIELGSTSQLIQLLFGTLFLENSFVTPFLFIDAHVERLRSAWSKVIKFQIKICMTIAKLNHNKCDRIVC